MSRRWSSSILDSNSSTVPLGATGIPAGVSFRGVSVAKGIGVTEITIPRPTGVVVDDVMIAQINGVSDPGAGVFNTPPGWTYIRDDFSFDAVAFQWLFWKRATISEATNYTFIFTELVNVTVSSITAYFNVTTTGNPIDSSSGLASSPSSTSVVAPALTTSNANTVRTVHYFSTALAASSTTWTQDPAITERHDDQILTTQLASGGDERFTTAGLKSTRTATLSNAGVNNIGQSAALILAGTPPLFFTGIAEDVSDFKGIRLFSFSDQDSTDAGVEVRWSTDGVNFNTIDRFQDQFTAHAGKALSEVVPVRAKFVSVKYSNGPVPQTVFRLQTTATSEPDNANYPQPERNVLPLPPTTYLQADRTTSVGGILTLNFAAQKGKNHYVTALAITPSVVQDPAIPFRITDGLINYYWGYYGDSILVNFTHPIKISTGNKLEILLGVPPLPTQDVKVSMHVITLPVSLAPATP